MVRAVASPTRDGHQPPKPTRKPRAVSVRPTSHNTHPEPVEGQPAIDPQTTSLLSTYLDARSVARNLSTYTLRNYRSDLDHFFLALAEWKVNPLEAKRADLRRYLALLLDKDVAPASVTRKVSTIRSFYKWLRTEEKLDTDPFFGVAGPRQPKRLPVILTPKDIDQLIAAADDSDPGSMRDRALLELL